MNINLINNVFFLLQVSPASWLSRLLAQGDTEVGEASYNQRAVKDLLLGVNIALVTNHLCKELLITLKITAKNKITVFFQNS